MAAGNGHLDVVRQLVQAGAVKSVQTKWGTPLIIAAQEGHRDVADILSGAAPTAEAKSGRKKRGKKGRR